MLADNKSDHVPVQSNLNYSQSLETIKNLFEQISEILVSKQKMHWSNLSQEDINKKYAAPIRFEQENLNLVFNPIKTGVFVECVSFGGSVSHPAPSLFLCF